MTSRLPLVAAALLLTVTACGSSDDNATVESPPSSTATSSATTGSAPTIQIKSFAYNDLTVAPGTTITVKNLDDAAHTVTSDTKDLFDADDVEQGTPKSFTAPSKAGSYTYHCTYHSNMHGTLTVS